MDGAMHLQCFGFHYTLPLPPVQDRRAHSVDNIAQNLQQWCVLLRFVLIFSDSSLTDHVQNMLAASAQSLLDGAQTNWYKKYITVTPGTCSGDPCVLGSRLRVADVVDAVANEAPLEELLEDYDFLSPEAIVACILFVATQNV